MAPSIQKKNGIQLEGVKLLYKTNRILLTWATGCGKTLGSLKIIKHWHENTGALPSRRGYIVCKEKAHLNNFKDDIDKHRMGFINDISESFLYASLHKHTDPVDFIVLDEVHALTPKRILHLAKIIQPHTLVVALSATLDYEKATLLRGLLGAYTEYHISIPEAIDMGLLPEPKVYLHNIELEPLEQDEYNALTKQIQYYAVKHEKEPKDWYKLQLKRLGLERKKYLSDRKFEISKSILDNYFKNKRFICFSPNKAMAEDLAYYWDKKQQIYVHSGNSDKANEELRNDFNRKDIDHLFVVKMFKEAVNLTDIDSGLIIQLDNVQLSFIQMLGRVFRGQFPEMHVVVFRGTKDAAMLSKVLRGFPNKYIVSVNHD